MINCQTCFTDYFSFNCLKSNFCFRKRYTFRRQTRTAVMDARFYFRSSNSTGKMMTCSMDNQKTFWGTASYAQRPRLNVLRPKLKWEFRAKGIVPHILFFWGNWSTSALRYPSVDYFGRIRTTIYGKQHML